MPGERAGTCLVEIDRPLVDAMSPIRVEASDVDEQVTLTRLALVGLGLGAVLAIFGLPPVDLHGPLHRFGVMDPACGLTRAVRSTMRGDIRRAIGYNPAGLVLVGGAIVAAARAVVGALTGSWLTVRLHLGRRSALFWSVLFLAALWANQQSHAALLSR